MDFVWNFVSVAVGGVATWAVARYYYRRAADDLKEDLEGLIKKVEETESSLKQWIVAMS
jgi:uncharacterized membrane-anchored protein